MRLPESQVAVLEAASATEQRTIDQLSEATGLKPETVAGAAFDLEDAGLVTVTASETVSYTVTDEGATYADAGLPEVRLYRAAVDAGAADAPVPMGEVIGAAGLDGPAVDIALANYARKGYGEVASGQLRADPDADPAADVFHLCADRGWVLTELTPLESSLEDVFRELTETPDAPAAATASEA